MRRGSRARRQRQLDRLQGLAALSGYRPDLDWSTVPRKLIGWHRAALRRRMGVGWLFWAPLPADPEAARQEFSKGWVSLGWTDDGFQVSESLRGPSADYVVVDEVHHWLTHTEGGAIDGPRGRLDWTHHRDS